MDDGFQNFTLAKDLSLVVVDAETGFGNGHVLPAGPLREPIRQGLARADAVVLMGDGTPDLQGFDGPVLRARLVPATQTALQDARVVAFAGIGRPEKFFHTLQALGANVVERHAFADHHAFTSAEIAQLKDAARRLDARLVTTEKDRARLSADAREGVETLGVDAIFEGPEALSRLMAAARINVHS
jgi:tetraacyldisaccharide 4'-kinase